MNLKLLIKSKININEQEIVAVLSVIILFITSWAPFVTKSALSTDIQRTLFKYFVWVCVAVGFLICKKRKTFSTFEVTAMAAVLIYRIYNIFYSWEPFKGLGLSIIAFCFFLCYQTDDVRALTFKYFKSIMVAVSVVGILCFISLIFHLGIPYTIVERGDAAVWINYKFCYFMTYYSITPRFTGTFEEPGWFGTWAAFFLCADDCNFKKKGNIILFLAGFLTFSLAFIMMLVVFYILKNLNSWKNWIWLVVLAVLFIFAIPNITTGIPAVDRLLQRMVITNEGLVGDNRHGSLFAIIWEQTINSNDIFLGHGAGYAEYFGTGIGQGLASIKSYVVNFGIVGTAIIFIPIFLASILRSVKEKNKLMLLYILITFISLYQRPYLFWEPYFIVFVCGVSYTRMIKEEKCHTSGQVAH